MSAKHRYASTLIRRGLLDAVVSFSDLERRISALPSEKERGDTFEAFAEAYLSTQKIVQADQVWPEGHIPIEVLIAHRLPERDLGADGVFRTWAGELNAYQVKFRTGRASLTWQELSTFMGLTDRVHERVLFTNSDDLPAVMNDRSGFYCIRGSDLDRLTAGDFASIREWLASGRMRVERKTPDPHQVEAIAAIKEGLARNDRATAVMACGTGKTLVALWVAENPNYRRMLVLVPSLSLVRQTLHAWLKETAWERPRFLCVCSDPTVTRGTDEIIVEQSDVDFPVTTDPHEVRSFLAASSAGVSVVFTTYQSSKVVGAALDGTEGFDLGVFDEAHKTAGREGTNFAFALRDENLRIAKRLFMTATPRHYDVRRKDKEGDAALVYSMDIPEVYGATVYTLPFAEAARRGIICGYKVIISVITSEMLNDELLRHGDVVVEGDVVRARQVAHQLALQRSCETHDLRRVITFHSKVKTARDFTAERGQSIRTFLPDYGAFHVNGEMPTAKRETLMTAFKEAERAIMSNARCLTEGVDVPTVDMVAFMAPKKSRVDIVQAVGRAMRKVRGSEEKTVGYVMVPLYIENASGETIEEALKRTDFDDVWDVLQAMQEQDDVLVEVIRQLRAEKGRIGSFDDNSTRERIEVLGPLLLLDELRRSITTMLVDRLGVAWDERFGELTAFKQSHGHCRVPQGWPDNQRLASWVNTQRTAKADGKLSAERIQRLDDLGFDWDPIAAHWEEMFSALERYKAEHDHCRVPQRWAGNPRLAWWVSNQRQARAKGKLSLEQIERVNSLGFDWDPRSSDWEEMFSALQRYKTEHDHCRVPQRWAGNPQLAAWVRTQRAEKGKLSAERVQRLDDLGFEWDQLTAHWEAMFSALERYKEAHGHSRVPQKWGGNSTLASWVGRQRTAKADGKLSAKRVQRFIDLGFEWDPHSSQWDEMFSALQLYKAGRGHCRVPKRWPDNSLLGGWVDRQRAAKVGGKLSQERVQRLTDLGFEWDPHTSQWEAMFSALQRHKGAHGHCRVPNQWPDNPQLGRWISRQRAANANGKLSQERVQRLTDLGFEWDPLASDWEEMFSALQRYQEAHGHCRVPNQWPDNPQLGMWVGTQRAAKANGKLSAEHVQRLDDLGIEWDPLASDWEEMVSALRRYKEEHDHCRVPQRWVGNPRLGTWVSSQRTAKAEGKLSAERVQSLNDLGFQWKLGSVDWEAMFSELQRYKVEHHDCRVPKEWADNPHLRTWVQTQRRNRAKGHLSAERVLRLTDLGFEWQPYASNWEKMFSALQQFSVKHGHSRVPQVWPDCPQLGTWVSRQRRNRVKEAISPERIKRLDDIGFDWGRPSSERRGQVQRS